MYGLSLPASSLLPIKSKIAVIEAITGNKTSDISFIQAHIINLFNIAVSAGVVCCTDKLSPRIWFLEVQKLGLEVSVFYSYFSILL